MIQNGILIDVIGDVHFISRSAYKTIQGSLKVMEGYKCLSLQVLSHQILVYLHYKYEIYLQSYRERNQTWL